MKAAAEKLRVHLVGVAMDEEGILPDALRAACKEYKPKAVYLIPTLHNPTTATLGPDRRKIIADIIRRNGLFLIEDDAYGLLEPTVVPDREPDTLSAPTLRWACRNASRRLFAFRSCWRPMLRRNRR